MIIFWHLRWHWLCWLGLHEYFIAFKKPRPTFYTCDVCGKRKPVEE